VSTLKDSGDGENYAQNYQVSELYSSSGIKILENTMFRKLDVSFLWWGREGRPNRASISLPLPEDGKRSHFRNVICSGI
jgi:hypothetical protein